MGARRWVAALRRRGRAAPALAALGALALAVLALALAGRAAPLRCELRTHTALPHHHPAAVAHVLADVSRRPALTAWRVLSDRGNYTSWRYSAAFECGPGCDGEATVEAHESYGGAPGTGWGRGPAHGRASRHEVRVVVCTCAAPPMLPWPRFCDEMETVTWVRGDGGSGALLEERAALWTLRGACARELRARRDLHLAHLRRALDGHAPA